MSRGVWLFLGAVLKKRRVIKTTEVTIETEEKILLRSTRVAEPHRGAFESSTLMWCPVCRRQVEMVTTEQAAEIAGVSGRTIYRWIETRGVHLLEGRGNLWICVVALSQRRKK